MQVILRIPLQNWKFSSSFAKIQPVIAEHMRGQERDEWSDVRIDGRTDKATTKVTFPRKSLGSIIKEVLYHFVFESDTIIMLITVIWFLARLRLKMYIYVKDNHFKRMIFFWEKNKIYTYNIYLLTKLTKSLKILVLKDLNAKAFSIRKHKL